ncbi:hypothetical protein SAY87_001563 [Trapa incisa]|uniref:Disease resistance protein RPM1-like n=1 Tax=Trapa incisa TaxID=236973 RepID=A0AAN7GVH4_9MYRT|nr:hypothetical protein SAY87_001563 [Trapa incisa]
MNIGRLGLEGYGGARGWSGTIKSTTFPRERKEKMAEGPVTFLLNKLSNFLEYEICHFRNIQEEIIYVRDELARVKAFLKIADSLEESDEQVKVWVEQIRDLTFNIEDILDEFMLLSIQDHGHVLQAMLCKLRNMKARYRVIHELKQVNSRIKSICEGHKRFRPKLRRVGQHSRADDSDNHWYDHRSDALLLDKSDLVGIEESKRILMEHLVDGLLEREVISVVGMGGLGKTTLVKQVYDDPAVKKHFHIRVWLTFSTSCKLVELLKDMLQQIACQIRKPAPQRVDTSNKEWLKMMIKGFLLNKRYLIVLDDVWNVIEWEAIKYAFPNDGCGSRVMLTTRNADVASASQADFGGNIHKSKPLNDEESWKLFCRKTFSETNLCPPSLEETCKSILKKCEGLPLPIVAISGVLASKDTQRVDEWDLVRRSLRAEIDGNDRLKKINKVLSLSFNELPYYLKCCFLHLSVFPEGYGIERMRLIRLWVAEGFVEAKEGRTLEEAADYYLKELLNRSLLQVTEWTADRRVKVCRIHHLLQQIAIKKSKEQSFAARVDEQNSSWPDKVRRLSVHTKFQSSQQNMSLSQLRSLYMSGAEKSSLKAALQHVGKLLTVLDLQAVPNLGKFPMQVLEMYSLRYLSLRYTEVKTVPSSIGKLQNLETLDLKYTYVTVLPREIMELRRLRQLLVYRYETISYSHSKYGFRTPADIGSLQSLQKLCYWEADGERSCIIMRDIGKMLHLRRLCILKLKKEDGTTLCSSISRLTNLVALSVTSLDEDEEVLDLQNLSSPPPLLQRIYLKGRLLEMPHWIPTHENIVTLHLRLCCLKDDPLISLQNLPNLVHLELEKVYDWKVLHFKAKGFKKLQKLGLDNYVGLRGIEVEGGAMPSLVQLIIQRCKVLRNVPVGIEYLTTLKLLEFFDVHDELVMKLEHDDQSQDYQRVAHIPELRYGSWTDGGWDVKSVDRTGDEAGSSHGTNGRNRGELPPCWK